ncbi:MAG TPA: 3-deoxy-D-manno-octulosonic acid transferase [Terracidiphilus sp.]|nr:3-deoxy-D-manno-octulosonic acid transferase [Terracidiphilus sp.]
MVLFLYNVALLVALLVSAPWWLFRMATTHKYREGLWARLGGVPRALRQRAAARPVVWLHAVSVGEVLAVSRLVSELDRALPEMQVLISTTTRTGQALARERFGADRVFYCPLDLPWAVRAYLRALQPQLLVLAETEFWPNLLSGCARRGVPVAVVNGRISDRSWPRYRALRGVWRPFLQRLCAVLAQTTVDAERLTAIGCRAEAVSVAGNLKFDVRAAQEAEATRQLKAMASQSAFLVAGSTLEGEEAAIIAAHQSIRAVDHSLITVLAPRHPERFNAVAAQLEVSGVRWSRRSAWKEKEIEALEPLEPGSIVLLDTIGELASVYSLAAVAFVGGSVVAAGGHNPLEPAQFGVPIVMGPNYENFRAIVEDLRTHNAIRISAQDTLTQTLLDLLTNREDAAGLGARASEVFEAQAGATARCVEAISALAEQEGRAQ